MVTFYLQFLCSDRSKFDRWVHAENLCSIWKAEGDRDLCHLVMFLTVFFFWMYKMKYSCYPDSSIIHGWIVYCAFGWEMHRMAKSLEIRFRMASFSKLSLFTCPCLRCKRKGWKVSNDSGLTWWPSGAASRLVSLRNYCLWCVCLLVFLFPVSIVDRSLCGYSLCMRQWSYQQQYQV